MIRGAYDRRIYYRYLSDGTKLSLGLSSSTATQRYIGSLVYDNGKFESASFGGGRLVGTNNGTDSEAHYFVTDHLGSTRVVAKVTSAGCEDLDRKDYYPFGKVWQQSGMPASGNRYTFSGKEQQRAGLASTKLLDFGARFYDPDGVTFLQQDPLQEKYYSIGQYNYCAGNPIRFSDKEGKSIKDAVIGYAVGLITNLVPGTTGLRASYSPVDGSDYNNALQTSDVIAGTVGVLLSNSGDGMMATGAAATALATGATVATSGASAEVTVPLAAAGEGVALVGLGTKALGATLMGNSAKNASKGYDYKEKSSGKSINQLNKSLNNKTKGNKNIKRFDKGKIKGEQDHVHFEDGSALNKDGSWKHGQRELMQEERNYLQENGWEIE